jgi:DNA-directed RNA polymerase specialized sigma24 family protein
MQRLPDTELTAEFAVQAADELRRLLVLLDEQELKEVALAKMEGYTNDEIGERLGKSKSSVERKLRLIRKIWQAEPI